MREQPDARLARVSADIMSTAPDGEDIAFLHAAFCHVGMPRSKPKGTTFERRSGSASVRLEAGRLWDGEAWEEQSLPYGTRPRLLLLHIIREYTRTGGDRSISLGDSMADFMRHSLGLQVTGGRTGTIASFKSQVKAFAACRMLIGWKTPAGAVMTRPAERVVSEFEAWPQETRTGQRSLWPAQLTISEEFARSIVGSAVPLDARAIRTIQDSALAIDIYAWLAHRLHRVQKPTTLYWNALKGQFGEEFSDIRNFKRTFLTALRKVLAVYPQARVDDVFGGIRLLNSPPPVPERAPLRLAVSA